MMLTVQRRLRVAMVSFDFPEYVIRLAGGLAQHVDVMLCLPEDEAAGYLPLIDPAIRFVPFVKPRLRQPVRQLRMVLKLLQQIRQFKPDILHLQQGHLWFNLALPLLHQFPFVLTIHDPHHHLGDAGAHRTPQFVMDFGFRRARRLIIHSQKLKDILIARLGVPGRIVDVIPHPALGDNVESPPGDERHIQTDTEDVLFFGRIWPYKGLEYLIRAQPRISAEFPRARIVIAGMGEDFDRYRRMIHDPSRFTIKNTYVSDVDRAELFARARVVVLPYVEASQSGVIPLAYRFGKPVVVTSVGGLPEMVDDGITGFVVPPRDEHALAEAVLRLLRDDALRIRLGENGRRKLDTECAPDVVARQTLATYCRALDLEPLTGLDRTSGAV